MGDLDVTKVEAIPIDAEVRFEAVENDAARGEGSAAEGSDAFDGQVLGLEGKFVEEDRSFEMNPRGFVENDFAQGEVGVDGPEKAVQESEKSIAAAARKSLVFERDMKKGETICKEDIAVKVALIAACDGQNSFVSAILLLL